MNRGTNNSDVFARAGGRSPAEGFSLLEVLAALGILALASSSVLVVIDRCIISAAESTLRMEAFQLAQENLEKVLVSDSVSETVEYGASEKYPDITWQTVIEAFPEPVNGQMWIRAVCSAEYMDSTGQTQTVELVHWITELTDQQAGQLVQQDDLDQLAADQLLRTVADAAQYAGVDSDVIGEWVEKGLVKTEDGAFVKYNLDLFMQSDGSPTAEEKRQQVKSVEELAMSLRTEQEKLNEAEEPEGKGPTGRSKEELEKMDAGEILNLLKQREKWQR